MAKRDTGYSTQQEQEIKKILGKNLRAARDNAAMTQEEVSQIIWKTGNRNRISEIENGKVNLSAMDLIMFHNLYGQSIDYICGLSIEPEMDALAGTVNHIVAQSKSMVDHLATQMAIVLTSTMKDACKSDMVALLDGASKLCEAVKNERDIHDMPYTVGCALNNLLYAIKHIEQKQLMQDRAVQTQVAEHIERMSEDHNHYLITDIKRAHQYSMPLPSPDGSYSDGILNAIYRYRKSSKDDQSSINHATITNPVISVGEVQFG